MDTNYEPSEAKVNDFATPCDRPTVAVVIPTFNQARFIADAITSVLAQTRSADEIIVVDDGSTDNPADVVARFPTVQFIRQDNRGPSGARNTGLRGSQATYILFLDADDRLLPTAIEAGLTFIHSRPDCGFVYGGYRHISEAGEPTSPDRVRPIDGDCYLALLRGNRIVMHATVLYRRDCVVAAGGFDETLWRAEDYDLYLRMAQRYPVASHSTIVAEYRRHGQNASRNSVEQLKVVRKLFDRWDAVTDAAGRAALREGRKKEESYYIYAMLDEVRSHWSNRHGIRILAKDFAQVAWYSPFLTARMLLGALTRRGKKLFSRFISV